MWPCDVLPMTVARGLAAALALLATIGRLRTVRQGPDGSLDITTSNGSGDRIVRITPG